MIAPNRRSFVAAIASGLALHVGFGRRSVVAARACDPTLPTGADERVTLTPIADGLPLYAPGQQLRLYRFTMPAGHEIDAHSHPGATMLQIESGEMSYTLLQGALRLWAHGKDGDREEGSVKAGETVLLGPGDSIFYDADTVHTAVNPGDAPVSVLAVTLLAIDQPQTVPANDPEAG